jgi:hypothetical protein
MSFKSATVSNGGTTTGFDPAPIIPSTTLEGDALVAIVGTTDNAPDISPTPPSGWTLQASASMPIDGTAAVSPHAVWIYMRDGGASAADEAAAGSGTYTWTFGGAEEQYAVMINADPALWGEFAKNEVTGAQTSINAPTVTTSVDDELVFHCALKDAGIAFTSTPSGTNLAELDLIIGATSGAGGAARGVWEEFPASTVTGVKAFTHASEESNGYTFSLTPDAADGIDSVDSSGYGDLSDELDFDDTNVDINGSGFGATIGASDVYLSPNDLLSEAGEVDITAAVNTWADGVINLDFSQLSQGVIDDLHTMGPGARFIIVNVGGVPATTEYFLAVALHRPKALEMAEVSALVPTTTTQRLTGFSGTFGGGRAEETAAQNPSTTDTNVADNGNREDLWAVEARPASREVQYDFRVLYGGVVADTITQTPQVTISGIQQIAVGQVIETDLAQAVTAAPGNVNVPVGQVTETNLAQAIVVAGAIALAVGQVTETDLAQAVTPVSGATTISIGQVIETDLAQPVTVQAAINIPVGQITETDLAQAVTAVPGTSTIVVGQVIETDLAQAIAPVFLSPFEIVLSANVPTGGIATTDRLTGGNTHGGGRLTDDSNPDDAVDLGNNESGEWAFVLKGSGTEVLGEQYSFRLVIDPGTLLDTYTVEPKWTIEEPGIAVGQVIETDTANAVTVVPGLTGIAVGQVIETDIAAAIVVEIALSVGQVTETDLAQIVTPVPGIATIAVGQVTEIDLAQAVTVVPGATSIAVGQITEIDLAQIVTPVPGELAIVVGQVTEIDLAQPVTVVPGVTLIPVGQVIETDLAQAVGFSQGIAVPLGQASETDIAQPVTAFAGTATIVTGQVIETDLAQPITAIPEVVLISVGQVIETDLAQAITIQPSIGIAVGQVIETDLAQAITVQTVVTTVVGQVTETDLAQPVGFSQGIAIPLGQAIETDLAQVVTPVPGETTIVLGQVIETDLAQSITVQTAINIAVSQVIETDLAQPITIDQEQPVAVGQVIEIDLAQVVTPVAGELIEAVGQVIETDLAQPVTVQPSIGIAVGQITETDLAQSVTALPGTATIVVGQVVEIDLAQLVEVSVPGWGDVFNAVGYFPTGETVTIELYDPLDKSLIALNSNECPENNVTGLYIWDTTKLTVQPTGYKEYAFKMTDGTSFVGGIINMFDAEDSVKLLEIWRRLALDPDNPLTNKDDGSIQATDIDIVATVSGKDIIQDRS